MQCELAKKACIYWLKWTTYALTYDKIVIKRALTSMILDNNNAGGV